MTGIDTLATISEIKNRINAARSIALFAHINVDGDAIGSMLALYEFLERKNKNVSMFCDQKEIPKTYSFLKNANQINKKRFEKYDLLISVDSASSDRLGKYSKVFTDFRNTINIDHHISNTNFAKINLVVPYSSCGEIIFEMLKEMNADISDSIATALFTAVSSDTNNFLNNNITAKTYLIASNLTELGAEINQVNQHLHKNKTLKQLKLAGYMATNLIFENNVSYLIVKMKNLEKLNVKESELSRFLNLITDVEEAKITFLMKEVEKNKYRISFRSVKEVNVGKIATIFNGGGHKNASACTIEGKSNKILKKVLKECYKEIDRSSIVGDI